MDYIQFGLFTASIITTFNLHKFQNLLKSTNKRDKNEELVSKRCSERMQSDGAGMSYLPDFLNHLSNQYDKDKNSKGIIAMCVAENNLEAQVMVKKKTEECCKDVSNDSILVNYTATTGSLELRTVLASFFSSYMYQDVTVDPDCIVVASGAAAILTELSLGLADHGDSVLIPTPYYAGFETDFYTVAGVVPIHVFPRDMSNFNLTPIELDEAYNRSMKKGHTPKVLLISNPNNPCGFIYTPDQLRNLAAWTRSKDMHLVVDEVFALSVFDRDGDASSSFHSVASANVLGTDMRDDVHCIWALSKDFCASGLRFGTLYTKNKKLMAACANMNLMSMVSNLQQIVTTRMLKDKAWVNSFLVANQNALREAYNMISTSLETVHIPVTRARAGLFLWADFRHYMPEQTFECERELYKQMLAAGVILTPGEGCRCSVPGFFRIVYAWVSKHSQEEAMRRIIRALVHVKEMNKK